MPAFRAAFGAEFDWNCGFGGLGGWLLARSGAKFARLWSRGSRALIVAINGAAVKLARLPRADGNGADTHYELVDQTRRLASLGLECFDYIAQARFQDSGFAWLVNGTLPAIFLGGEA